MMKVREWESQARENINGKKPDTLQNTGTLKGKNITREGYNK